MAKQVNHMLPPVVDTLMRIFYAAMSYAPFSSCPSNRGCSLSNYTINKVGILFKRIYQKGTKALLVVRHHTLQ